MKAIEMFMSTPTVFLPGITKVLPVTLTLKTIADHDSILQRLDDKTVRRSMVIFAYVRFPLLQLEFWVTLR